jgi:dihydroxy-acid dehydratase
MEHDHPEGGCVLQADQGCDFDFLVRDGARTTPKKDE